MSKDPSLCVRAAWFIDVYVEQHHQATFNPWAFILRTFPFRSFRYNHLISHISRSIHPGRERSFDYINIDGNGHSRAPIDIVTLENGRYGKGIGRQCPFDLNYWDDMWRSDMESGDDGSRTAPNNETAGRGKDPYARCAKSLECQC